MLHNPNIRPADLSRVYRSEGPKSFEVRLDDVPLQEDGIDLGLDVRGWLADAREVTGGGYVIDTIYRPNTISKWPKWKAVDETGWLQGPICKAIREYFDDARGQDHLADAQRGMA